MSGKPLQSAPGPFRADQLRSGDPYELSDGHPVECLPSGGRHAKASISGGLALETDPAVDSAGFDAGYTCDDMNLRAPDIAVGNVPDEPGWVAGAPPLAVEYADSGQDERDLQDKIGNLLSAGTRFVWVVRLTGTRRIEVYEPGKPHYLAYPGSHLEAPGVLQNPVAVEALYDSDVAHETALSNLLQRRGYANLDAVRQESRSEGREEGRDAGRDEGELGLVLRLVERAFGEVGSRRERIAGLDSEGLTALAEVLFRLDGLAALDTWLDENGGSQVTAL